MGFKLKKRFIKWAADIRLYKGGLILFGNSHYRLKGEDVRRVITTIKPGDVLLRRYDHYLGGLLTPGFYTHAAIVSEYDRVIHMLAGGICDEDILTFCRTDHVLILRPTDPALAKRIVRGAKWYRKANIEYDYDFVSTNKAFYCTELVWVCCDKSPEIEFDKYILPDDFICPLFDVVLKVPNNGSNSNETEVER